MENVNKDDKMTINYKNNELTFIGLKEALKEYNEQNINTIMSNIIFILEKQSINENISTEDYFKLWTSQYEILNQDYGFSTKDNNIIFYLTNAYFHRYNVDLINLLELYIDNIQNNKNNESNKIQKLKELTDIKDTDIYKQVSKEQNLSNLLVMICNKFGTEYINIDFD